MYSMTYITIHQLDDEDKDMTQIEFAKILNEMIESIPNTKNEIIGRTGIDRSTFFKFLSGKRFPTADQ